MTAINTPAPAPAAPPANPAVNPQLIVQFVRSVQEVISTMAGVTTTVGKPHLKASPAPTYDVSGIIGFSGQVIGSMVVSFPAAVAEKIASAFAGVSLSATSPDFADAVGELANMIAGNAKKDLGASAAITVPNVIIGAGHTIARLAEVPCVVIPCHTPHGDFAVEVCIKKVV